MKPCKHYPYTGENSIYLGWYMVWAGGQLRVMDMYFIDRIIPDIIIIHQKIVFQLDIRILQKQHHG